MNRRVLAGGTALAIAAALGAAFVVRHDTDTAAADTAVRTTAPGGGARLSVRPGGGATAVAANGFTPIAYPATCEGAVAAIASAEQLLPVLGAVTGVTDEQWQLTIDRIYGADTPTASYYAGIARAAAADPSVQRVSKDGLPQLDMRTHPEWGGFRVVACKPGVSATVELLSCYSLAADRRTACYADARAARWTKAPADWVVQEHQADKEVVPPVLRSRIDNDADALSGSAPPAQKRTEWLTALGAGWQEFSNAPQ